MGPIPMKLFWTIAMIAFVVIEAAVPGLVSIWFAIGSLGALVAAMLKAPLWLQITMFFAVSILSLIATRPLAKKYVNAKVTPTNADAVIGKECVITSKVDNIMGTGSGKVDGKEWTVRSEDDKVILEKGSHAKVKSIEGVKLIVKLEK